jgi:agmatinase
MMSSLPTNLGLVALPFEVSTTMGKGTIHGPDAILNELDRLDSYNFDLARDPFRGIPRSTIRPHGTELVDARIQQAVSGRVVGELLDGGGFPICIGGEHTISLGPVRAAHSRSDVGVVQMDAHADLRDTYDGNPLNHACVMRRIIDMGCRTLGVGIRSMSEEEAVYISDNSLPIVTAREVMTGTGWYDRLADFPEHIYLTIDLDYFDPTDVPSVGTPEPGGPSWYQSVAFLQHLFATKHVVAADIVELMPGRYDDSSVRLAARLVGLLVGLRFTGEV